MIIRSEQMQAFEAASQGRFEAALLDEIRRTYPRATRGVQDAALQKMIDAGCRRATDYGFETRGPVRMFLHFQVLLGHEFDYDPLLYWIRDMLADRKNLQPEEQAARLHLHVSTYLDLSYGKGGEHVMRGLEHIARAERQELVDVGRAYESKAIPWLQALHPRKCAWAGPQALGNLVSSARSAAAAHALPDPEGPPLMLGLMFAFGASVATDPLFPWVAASLDPASEPDPRKRLERLIIRTQGYMRQALEDSKERLSHVELRQ